MCQMARTCSFSHDNGFFKLRTCAYAESSQVDPTVNILLRVGTVSVGRVVGVEAGECHQCRIMAEISAVER